MRVCEEGMEKIDSDSLSLEDARVRCGNGKCRLIQLSETLKWVSALINTRLILD